MTESLPSSRAEAKGLGFKRYFTGNPCKRGHIAERYTSTHQCAECVDEHKIKWRSDNYDKHIQQCRDTYQRHKESYQEKARERYKENPEKHRASVQRHYIRNADKVRSYARRRYWSEPETFREKTRIWTKNNPGLNREQSSRYKASKKQAKPSWYESELCAKVYQKAFEIGGHVDHVVPLQSTDVCGLHCWDNLQILPPEANMSKSNIDWPDMPIRAYKGGD